MVKMFLPKLQNSNIRKHIRIRPKYNRNLKLWTFTIQCNRFIKKSNRANSK